jgi:hypothetical protein
MTKLIALLALAGAVAAAVFFWRKNDGSWESMWSSTKDTTSSWSQTAAQEAGRAADGIAARANSVTSAASHLAEEAKGDGSQAHEKVTEVADKVVATADSAAEATSDVADKAKGEASD